MPIELPQSLRFVVSYTGPQAPGELVSSVALYAGTQFETVFNFSEPRRVLQYADGTWAVQGPVTITSVTPASQVYVGVYDGVTRSGVVHGMKVGWEGAGVRQGYDSRGSEVWTDGVRVGGSNMNAGRASYETTLNRCPGITGQPVTVPVGTVVTKAISDLNPHNAGAMRCLLRSLAVLDVVATLPPPNSLRPGLRDPNRAARFNVSDIDLSVLRNLPAPTGTGAPSFAQMLSRFQYPISAWNRRWGQQRNIMAFTDTMAQPSGYGTHAGDAVQAAAIAMQTNGFTAEQKAALAVLICQEGIDWLSIVAQDGDASWDGPGGHYDTRKWTTVFAKLMLGEELLDITWQAANYYYYIPENRAGIAPTPQNIEGRYNHLPYQLPEVGLPAYRPSPVKNSFTSALQDGYTSIQMQGMQAGIQAISLFNLPAATIRAAWGYDPAIDASERWMNAYMAGLTDTGTNGTHHPTTYRRNAWTQFEAQSAWPRWTASVPERPNGFTGLAATGSVVSGTFQATRLLNGGTLTRRDIRVSVDGTNWAEFLDVPETFSVDPGFGGIPVLVQGRFVTTAPGAWSYNEPKLLGGPARNVVFDASVTSAPVNIALPFVTGFPVAGNTLSANAGAWAANPSISGIAYQWQRGGVNISGAVGDRYTLTAEDVGAVITVVETTTNANGSTAAASLGTATVTATGIKVLYSEDYFQSTNSDGVPHVEDARWVHGNAHVAWSWQSGLPDPAYRFRSGRMAKVATAGTQSERQLFHVLLVPVEAGKFITIEASGAWRWPFSSNFSTNGHIRFVDVNGDILGESLHFETRTRPGDTISFNAMVERGVSLSRFVSATIVPAGAAAVRISMSGPQDIGNGENHSYIYGIEVLEADEAATLPVQESEDEEAP